MYGDFWDKRYSLEEYVYGETPNIFFANQIKGLEPGTLVLPCEGEGRNAVYAASLGWNVWAFDTSKVGREKAMRLAEKRHVIVHYALTDACTANYPPNSVDVIAFIYAHLPPTIRQQVHQRTVNWLKPGGKLIMEAFNPAQLQYTSGGPKEVSMLYTETMMQEDFEGMHIERLATMELVLQEGRFHHGQAAILQMVASKAL